MVHLVQIGNGTSRRVALVEEPGLRCLEKVQSVYALAQEGAASGAKLDERVLELAHGESLDYDPVFAGTSAWHLLPPIDVPGGPSRLMISGTGLTHLGSAKDRQVMHLAGAAKAESANAEALTDSMRMFQWGVQGGRPAPGEIGIAPEWFYKGNGSVLRGPLEPLTVPAYGEDGGEEAEIAGVYLIGEDGTPCRIGMTVGNEFSDHKFEKRNYLISPAPSCARAALGSPLSSHVRSDDGCCTTGRSEYSGTEFTKFQTNPGNPHPRHHS